MEVITLKWLEKRNTWLEVRKVFSSRFGETASVKEVVDYLHEIERPDWEAWFLGQTIKLTIPMVEQGANIHAKNDWALVWAAKYGRFGLIKYLVEQGANIYTCNTALYWATEYGHLEVVKYLVENGANIHTCDDITLRWAALYGHLEVVKYLVEKGANVHACNDYNALSLAVKKGHSRVASFLRKVAQTQDKQ